MEDKDSKSIWQRMKQHPVISVGALLAVVLVGAILIGMFASKPAKAASVTFNNALCVAFTWDDTTKTLTCVPVLQPTPVPPDPPVPPVTDCPANTLWVKGKWGANQIYTRDFPNQPFKDQWLVIEVKPPVGWSNNYSPKSSSWVEYQDNAAPRRSMFSTKPCTFAQTYALRTGNGTVMYQANNNINFSFAYKSAPSTASSAALVAGQTYYINAKNEYADGTPSCATSCNMSGSIPN